MPVITRIHVNGASILLFCAIYGVLIALFAVVSVFHRDTFSSTEINFIEKSAHGLGIVPASCASSPSYYHYNLATTSDGHGLKSQPGETADFGYFADYGAGVNYLCVNNSGSNTYFIPMRTAAEMNSFKARNGTLPGLQIY